MDMKSMEKKFFSLKQYEKAEYYKKRGDILEAEEKR
jgi:hypothetical protein